jgi:hypothetical protein
MIVICMKRCVRLSRLQDFNCGSGLFCLSKTSEFGLREVWNQTRTFLVIFPAHCPLFVTKQQSSSEAPLKVLVLFQISFLVFCVSTIPIAQKVADSFGDFLVRLVV